MKNKKTNNNNQNNINNKSSIDNIHLTDDLVDSILREIKEEGIYIPDSNENFGVNQPKAKPISDGGSVILKEKPITDNTNTSNVKDVTNKYDIEQEIEETQDNNVDYQIASMLNVTEQKAEDNKNSIEKLPEDEERIEDNKKPIEKLAEAEERIEDNRKPIEKLAEDEERIEDNKKPIEKLAEAEERIEDNRKPIEKLSEDEERIEDNKNPIEKLAEDQERIEDNRKPIEKLAEDEERIEDNKKPIEKLAEAEERIEDNKNPIEKLAEDQEKNEDVKQDEKDNSVNTIDTEYEIDDIINAKYDDDENIDYEAPHLQTKTSRFKTKTSRNIFIALISLAIVAVISLGGYGIASYISYQNMVEQTINVDTFYDGVCVNGINLGGMTIDQATSKVKQTEQNLRPQINITITCAGNDYKLTQDNLSFTYNTDEVVKQAYNSGRDGSNSERYAYVENVKTNHDNYPVTCTLDPNNCGLDAYLDDLAQQVHIDPIKPNVSQFNPGSEDMFVYDNGCTGRDLNVEQLKTTLETTLSNKSYSSNVAAEVEIVPIPDTSADPTLQEQTALVSTFSTVSTNNAQANNNMALALSAINGTEVKPGETFSFNKTTGDTTDPSKGYQEAQAIINGELEDQYGGGICQAATTLYGAAMRADMDITTRAPHTWPSSYVPIGQDATVSYGSTDFCFKNSSEYPIFIQAGMSGNTLTVSIYGYHPTSWDTIDVVSQGNDDNTYATGSKIFYKDGQQVKTEAIFPSQYEKKQ